jgi:hypothetical protein
MSTYAAHRTGHRRSATAFTLGLAVASTLLIPGVFAPVMAALYAQTATAFEVAVPPVSALVMALSPWGLATGAAIIAVLLVAKDRWIGQQSALLINVTTTVVAVLVGGFAVVAVTAPIFLTMNSLI